MNILQAVKDRKVFGTHFRGPTYDAWFAFLAALFALPLTPEQLAIYQKHTGRSSAPTTPFTEGWLVIGRRGGKSFMLALIAVFLACFKDWRPFLGPGEVGTIAVVAADRKQARTIMRFALGLLKAVPMLRRQVTAVTKESVTLANDIVIEIHTASFRTVRGYTVVAALLDEIAFWPSDELASEPDVEVLNAIKPAMATVPGSVLLCASSPYARHGVLWDAYKKHYGKDADPVLVWQAATRDMNPLVPQAFIDEHMAADEARASAEYGGTFRTDIAGLFSPDAIMAAREAGIFERPKQHYVTYYGFVDPSGGSADSFALAIGHKDLGSKMLIIDCLREFTPPFSPEQVCAEMALTCRSYGVGKLVGDHWGGLWPKEMFSKHGIYFEQSARPKSDLYLIMLALVNSQRVALLDNTRLLNQLLSLERRTARSGRDSIDHPPGHHDDLANACAGLVVDCLAAHGGYNLEVFDPRYRDSDLPPLDEPPPREPVRANGDWWRGVPRSPPTYSANDRMRTAMGAIPIAELVEIFETAKAADQDVDRLHASCPAGIEHRLKKTELHARNLDQGFTRTTSSIITNTVLYGWDGNQVWPPRQTPVAAQLANMMASSFDPRINRGEWWKVAEEREQKISQDGARTDADIKARTIGFEANKNLESRQRG